MAAAENQARTVRTVPRLFDIRNIIGTLLGIYGVLLTIAGFVPGLLKDHSDPAAASNRSDLYIGTDANWWVGLVVVGVALAFFAWAALRPVRVEESDAPRADPDAAAAG
jgi:H+/Cl- antiporter ClcA